MSNQFNPDTKRILVIDGYGFRGIGPLFVIDRIVRSASLRAKTPLRPCDIFDLICGTSSGGLIAILLGRLGLDCETAITEYKKIVEECCGVDETRLWKGVLANQELNQNSYDNALSALVAKHSSADALMLVPHSSSTSSTNVSVMVTSGAPNYTNRAQCIRSYKPPTSVQNSQLISHQWLVREAAHAALGTPFFGYISPILLDGICDFQDSAFSGFNNPIMFAQREQKFIWPNAKKFLTISLGTDISSLVPPSLQGDWDSWSVTDAYCAPYVDAIIAKLGHDVTDVQRRGATEVVRKLIYVSAETTGQHLKASALHQPGSSYYRIDPSIGLDPIAFADIFYEHNINNGLARWCEDVKSKATMTAIVNSLVEENTEPMVPDDLRRLAPQPPPIDTVNAGYNPQLDKRRPESVIDYLQRYRVLFIMDDSGSMKTLWDEAGAALSGIAQHALEYNARSVDMVFLNSDRICAQIQGKSAVLQIFNEILPSGYTPTGAILKKHLNAHIGRLNAAIGSLEYGKIPPLDIIVITDGRPDDKPEDVIAVAENEIKAGKHHPNCIGIQFVQIGNDAGAHAALQALSYNAAKVGMVDTVLYDGSLSPEKLERILLGGIHPSLRPLLSQK